MEITINTKKKAVLKKLLNKTDAELKATIEKVLSDWANNIIQTKYSSRKTIEEMVDEMNN